MKRTIATVTAVLCLTALLSACSMGGNVSTDRNGRVNGTNGTDLGNWMEDVTDRIGDMLPTESTERSPERPTGHTGATNTTETTETATSGNRPSTTETTRR